MYALRLLRFVRPYKAKSALLLFCVIASSAAIIAMPQLIRWAIDYGLDPHEVDGKTVINGDKHLLVLAGGLIMATAVVRGVFAYGQTFLGEQLSQQVAYDIRNQIYDRLQRLSYAYHDQQQTGAVMSRATQDVEAVRMYVSMGLARGFYVLILLVAIFILMFFTNWQLALVVWLFVPLIAWRSNVMAMTLRPIWYTIQEGMARMATVLQEALSGARVVKAFAREDYESQKFRREATTLYDSAYKSAQVTAVNTPIMTGLWLAATAAVIWVGGIEVSHGNLEIGALTSFLLYVTVLQAPVRVLGWIIMLTARANVAGQRIFDVLDAESAVKEKPDAKTLTATAGHVQFQDVSFGYDAISPVLSHINIDAKPGQIIALMGPTGSGKTTVVNLMPRFYDVSAGSILIDGTDIRDLTISSLRNSIGIVQQDVFLFSATIHENIAYGAVDATEEQVIAAAKAAHIHEFIETLPDGYDSWVGERGITLSGGQKQRVAIARTLLLDPKILILDDSTSSVDTQTEYSIQQSMAKVMEGRTTFVIAQRLRTVKMADQIIVLQDGEIVEQGKHEELLEADGIYRQIYDLELRDQEEALAPPPPVFPELPAEAATAAGS
ncbi:MAG: ABC transporter ATP-binding protein [Chloroflexota bacterium]